MVLWDVIRGFQYAQTAAVLIPHRGGRVPHRHALFPGAQAPALIMATLDTIARIEQLFIDFGEQPYGARAPNPSPPWPMHCSAPSWPVGTPSPRWWRPFLHDVGHFLAAEAVAWRPPRRRTRSPGPALLVPQLRPRRDRAHPPARAGQAPFSSRGRRLLPRPRPPPCTRPARRRLCARRAAFENPAPRPRRRGAAALGRPRQDAWAATPTLDYYLTLLRDVAQESAGPVPADRRPPASEPSNVATGQVQVGRVKTRQSPVAARGSAKSRRAGCGAPVGRAFGLPSVLRRGSRRTPALRSLDQTGGAKSVVEVRFAHAPANPASVGMPQVSSGVLAPQPAASGRRLRSRPQTWARRWGGAPASPSVPLGRRWGDRGCRACRLVVGRI